MRGSRGGVTACVAWLDATHHRACSARGFAVEGDQTGREAHALRARSFLGGRGKTSPWIRRRRTALFNNLRLSRYFISTPAFNPARRRIPQLQNSHRGLLFLYLGFLLLLPRVWLLDPTSGGGVESAKLTTFSACLSSHPIPIPTPRRKGGAPSEARCA